MEKKQALILALGGLFTYLVYKLGRDTNKIKAQDFIKLSKDKKFPVPIKVKTYVSSPYGWRKNPITGARQLHNGIDLPAPTGTPIYSPLSGTVLKNFTNSLGGNQITIESGDVILGYAHLNKKSPLTEGSIVKQNDVIGEVGTTGYSTGAHLHFTVRINGNFVNPSDYFTV
jgi:murein DD-endopeptidase MepM/ murein hydrolase activator NlpD